MAKKSRASTGSAAAAVTASPKSKARQTTYNGFVALPLSVSSPVPIASSSKSPEHYLFVRAHTPKASASDAERERAERTLFVANVPVDLGTQAVRTLFGKWGVVEDVVLPEVVGDALEAAVRGLPDSDDEEDEDDDDEEGEKADDDGWTTVGKNGEFLGTGEKAPRSRRTRRKVAELPASVPTVVPLPDLSPRGTSFGVSGSRVAHVVFLDAVSVSRVLAYAGGALPAGDKSAEPTGLAFFEAQYDALRPSLVAVREHADSAMARYDHLHSLLLSSRARKHGAGALVDEEGFTVVVRGGRYGRTAGRGGDPGGAGVGVAARGFAKTAANKPKGKGAGELTDFYKFQAVDRKRQELAAMRARFADDQKKVEELKKSRRFKPY
ncbi:Ribosomal RNA-processing protein 7 A [Vanrija pseudolonga]|uniref:Ribosomal RNA-processing protein 7 A n=1 Tax=Vanrija pseudolonga TaxID=143232 RepID=A0AAF0Y477_9TREE|nr:Ribosomal RNA-processing protein 7 A [Vanrija pseudolonga]